MLIMLLGCLPESATIMVNDEHNFTFSSSVVAEEVMIASQEDASVDWSDLDVDMLGNTINGEVDKVSVLLFPRLGTEEVLFGLSNEALRQSDLSGYVEYTPEPGERSARLTDFSIQGTYVDPEEHLLPDNGSYLVTLSSEPNITHSMIFFHPTVSAVNSEVVLSSQSAEVSYEINLFEMDRIVMPSAERWLLDWSGLTESGTDRPLNLNQLDRVQLLGTSSSLAEVEQQFLRMESLAEQIYEANVLGQQVIPFSTLLNSEGASPDSLSEELLWILALRCSTCVNPAPLFVGVIAAE